MIKISGILNVKSIKGSRGAFSVGDLTTPVGNFKVKDQILDQFSEGSYEGEFLVAQIYPASYVHFGKVVTEVRAKLAEIFLANAEEKPLPEAPAPQEADPLDESVIATGATTATDASTAVGAEAKPKSGSPDTEPETAPAPEALRQDYELFGADLYELVVKGSTVKLDPTVDRARFRSQRDRLKELNYRFDAASQAWMIGQAEA